MSRNAPTLFDLTPDRHEVSDPELGAKSKAPAEQLHRLAGARLRVLEALRRGPLSTWDVVAVGGLRGAARVHELRELGYEIATTVIDGKVGSYLYTLKEAT